MSLLNDSDRAQLETEFKRIEKPVHLLFFSESLNNGQYSDATREILNEVKSLNENIELKEFNFQSDKEQVEKYNLLRSPAIVITGEDEQSTGIRFYGVPSGYEFISLIGSILDKGTEDIELMDLTQKKIKEIDKPVHIQVFTTPSCPHCPGAVRNAHKMAALNPNITADMIEAMEYPELSQRYQVRGVPKVVINEDWSFEGNQPEPAFLDYVEKAAGGEGASKESSPIIQ